MRRLLPALISGAAFLATSLLCGQGVPAKECPPQGDATKASLKHLNEARARLDDVTDDDVDDSVSMEEICEPGDDRMRWQDGQGVEITAYVVEVRDAGPASSNCHSARDGDHDTILELSPDAGGVDRSHLFYAVVTPQWRRAVAADHLDWSTGGLRAHYIQRWVTVRGWLLYDPEVEKSSLHTAKLVGPSVSRLSAWEIHPVTALDLEDDVLDQQAELRSESGASK
ncbi:MAG TPA: hypothetical protein VGK26_02355 [Thermoanaerobaculia bacterium]|jgi:hypothetical protein